MRRLSVLLLLVFAVSVLAADSPADSFTGHYELVKKGKSVFSLDVLQEGKTARVSFSAAHGDGSGAAPDGDGEGKVGADGSLQVHWNDTFDNNGMAVLRHDGKLFVFAMKPGKVNEPRALVFYGDVKLKRASAKPEMSTR